MSAKKLSQDKSKDSGKFSQPSTSEILLPKFGRASEFVHMTLHIFLSTGEKETLST